MAGDGPRGPFRLSDGARGIRWRRLHGAGPAMNDPTDTSDRHELSVREVAERFIELFYERDDPRAAFTHWVHPNYIQHNPNAPTGRDATLAMMEASIRRNPELTHEVKRVVFGDADLVAVHFHFRRQADHPGHAIVDILRIADGYIVEHWDVMQEVPDPATTKNNNGVF